MTEDNAALKIAAAMKGVHTRKELAKGNIERFADPKRIHKLQARRPLPRPSSSPLSKQHTNLSRVERVRQGGLKNLLVAANWRWLFVLLLGFYGTAGAFVGTVAYICSLSRSSDAEEADVDGPLHPVFLWWLRGFWLLLLNPIYSPASEAEIAAAIFAPIMGSIVSLMLFGIIYEKFSNRRSVCIFAQLATLRRGGRCHHGHPILTFRYANTAGLHLVNPDIRVTALKRDSTALAFDGLIIPYDCKLINPGCILPAAFFCHHCIDEGSPLYCAERPARCSFEGVLALFITITGTDSESQEEHGPGHQMLKISDVLCDVKFRNTVRLNLCMQHSVRVCLQDDAK